MKILWSYLNLSSLKHHVCLNKRQSGRHMFKIMLVCSSIMFNSLTALKMTHFSILCNPLLSKNWSAVWEILCANTFWLLIFSLNFLYLCRYFPVVRASKSTVQVHVSGDWVTSPAFKRILFCEAREMDRGANLFWHGHAGGSAIHSGKANRGGKTDHLAYSAPIVKKTSTPSGVHAHKLNFVFLDPYHYICSTCCWESHDNYNSSM